MKALVLPFSLLTAVALAANAAPAEADESPQTPFEKECHAAALLLEQDVKARNQSLLEHYFDTDACVERALEGLNAPGRVVEDFRRASPQGFFKGFATSLLEANSVRFLRLHRTDKEVGVLFRVVPKQGGVDYLELVFEKTRRGGAKVVDAHLFTQGQSLSHLLRCQFLPLSQNPERPFLEKLEQKDRELAENLPQINRMMALNGSARYGEVLAAFARLPDSVQKEKQALLQQLKATAQVDRRGFAAALDLWRATYPNEISIELIAANLHHARRQYEPAYAALEQLDKALGGDAYLDIVRAQWQKNQGHLEEARAFTRTAVAKSPGLHEGWELLISLGLTTRNYQEVAQALNDWEKVSQVDVVRVAESEKLADFARSAEGRQWLASRDSRRGAGAGSETKGSPTAGAKVNHRLQGIFYSASNPSAIISGRTVFPGDRLAGGYRVERISPKSVTLQSPEGAAVELALK